LGWPYLNVKALDGAKESPHQTDQFTSDISGLTLATCCVFSKHIYERGQITTTSRKKQVC
jgi:hypothetical protein